MPKSLQTLLIKSYIPNMAYSVTEH